MERRCIFCGDRADNVEHLWPEWVLSLVPPKTISGFIGRHKNLKFKREFTVRCVCQKRCNNGWMSDLETASTPILGALIVDKSMFLDPPQQWTIAAWAVKTAMVLDTALRPIGGRSFTFYSEIECHHLRESWEIPVRTMIWLGRFLGNALGAWSSELLGTFPDDATKYPMRASTLVMGSLAIQVLSARAPAKYNRATVGINPVQGPWNEILVTAWPSVHRIYWPPILAFDESKTIIDIQQLPARWRRELSGPLATPDPGGSDAEAHLHAGARCIMTSGQPEKDRPRESLKLAEYRVSAVRVSGRLIFDFLAFGHELLNR